MHFRSIGDGPDAGHTGAMPVVNEAAPAGNDGAKPLDLGNFGTTPGSGSLGLSPTPAPVQAPDVPLSDALGFELPAVGGGDKPAAGRRPTHRDVRESRDAAARSQSGGRSDRTSNASISRSSSRQAKPPTSLTPPMPTVSESSSGLWLIILAVFGVGAVILYFMMTTK